MVLLLTSLVPGLRSHHAIGDSSFRKKRPSRWSSSHPATGRSPSQVATRHSSSFFVVKNFHFWKNLVSFGAKKPTLVGGFNHLEKYESPGRVIPYIMEKNV